ncbi:hypothetical protein K505DRAFT_236332 [Melanomma pulvis-pyrius CBS 109.77]|uniref:F-box domain-containing protein n=1 Tax=Melanomma pulvis-pyrius CBS 109.77 TaxID=1314802 RepID=A0A6A6XKK2_9PLEO|nr:hypothetical protein K505DRAFT_236332 [Melanomma pulvis-pyrius CBS 109.77]
MVIGAAQYLPQWLSQRLVTLFRPRRPRSALGAFALPLEIILMIATYLTKPSVISLALTCRTLCSLCFPRRPSLNTAEQEELLLLLEKDIASLYFCHYCVKLHRLHTRWSQSIFPWIEKDLPCQDHFLPTCFVPFRHARLIMDLHFYRPTNGLPLHKFEQLFWYHCRSNRITDSYFLSSRIVDDEILVLSVKTMFHSRGDSKMLRGYVDSLVHTHEVCKHLTLNKGSPHDGSVQLPELAKGKIAPGHFAPCNQSFGSCTFCPTDYCIDISWRGRRKGYMIKVSVYRQLEDYRSPFDWSWRNMGTLLMADDPQTPYPLEYRPGIIRDRWNRADGIDGSTQGEWVRLPGRHMRH